MGVRSRNICLRPESMGDSCGRMCATNVSSRGSGVNHSNEVDYVCLVRA